MDRFTLPKIHLLRTTREFQRVYRHGQRIRGDGFGIIFQPNAASFSRLGVSVPKKTGNAVRRNRIKRLIREVFRLNRGLFPQACDIVVAVRPNFAFDRLVDLHMCVARIVGG